MANKQKVIKNKLKMVDLGRKPEKGSMDCCPKVSEGEVYYPTLWLNEKNIPFIKAKDVGSKKRLVIDATVKSYSLNKHKKGEEKESYDIEVNKIGLE